MQAAPDVASLQATESLAVLIGSIAVAALFFPIPIELIRPLLADPVPMPAPVATTNGALPVELAEPVAH